MPPRAADDKQAPGRGGGAAKGGASKGGAKGRGRGSGEAKGRGRGGGGEEDGANLETAKELAELEDNSVQLESSMEILRAKRAAMRSGRAAVRDTVRENEGVDEDDPLINMDEGVRLEPFNMRREMAEGHFDESGFYVLNKDEEKEVTDAWLDTVDQAEKTASFGQEARHQKAKELAAARISALKKNLGKDADEEEDEEDTEEKENEWTVEIDKSVGGRLGIGLDVKHSEELGDRIYIEDIDADGLLAKWNESNPTKTVQAGDRILQVNGESSTEEVTSGLGKHPVLKIRFIREEKEDPEEEKDSATMIEALIAELRPLETPVEALARWARGGSSKGGAAASRAPADKGLEPLKMRSRKRQQRAQAASAAPNGTSATGSKAVAAVAAPAASDGAADASKEGEKTADSAPSRPKKRRLDEFGNYQEYVKEGGTSAPTSIIAESASTPAEGSTATSSTAVAETATAAAAEEGKSASDESGTAKGASEAGTAGTDAGGTANGDAKTTEAQPDALVLDSTETSGVADAAAVAAAAERAAAADKAVAEAAKAAAAEARLNRHTLYMDVNFKGPEQAALEAAREKAEKKEEERPASTAAGQRKRAAEPGILEQARRKKIERLTEICDRLLERGVLVYDSTREQLAIEVRQRRGEFDKEEEEAAAPSSGENEKKDATSAEEAPAAEAPAAGAAAAAASSGSTQPDAASTAAAPSDAGASTKAEQTMVFVNRRCQPSSSTTSADSEESGLLKLLTAQPGDGPEDPEAGQAVPRNGHALRWQIRWTATPEQTHGPFDSVTMQGWNAQGCFSEERPAEVRQCNEANEPTEQCWHRWDEVDFALYS